MGSTLLETVSLGKSKSTGGPAVKVSWLKTN